MSIPPPSLRPTCVRVSWLAEHPGHAATLEYRDCAGNGEPEWRPAVEAIDMIQPEWPVEVRVKP